MKTIETANEVNLKAIETTTLTREEVAEIKNLVAEIADKYRDAEDPDFLRNIWQYNCRLPSRVISILTDYKYDETGYGVMVIKGFDVNQKKVGPTPFKESFKGKDSTTVEEEILLILYNSILGDVIGWDCQCDGRIINDIHPIKGNEFRQINSSSKIDLTWHIEESFHPYRADYISLFCLRNPDRVPSMFGSVTKMDLPMNVKKVLSEPRFIFHPEENFTKPRWREGKPSSVLFGDFENPYIRIDPDFMDPMPGDDDAKEALAYVIRDFDGKLNEISLEPGDCCFVDNFRAIHGRRAFVPKYDGNDRWLIRLNVARDLRKSRDARRSANSRVITTD